MYIYIYINQYICVTPEPGFGSFGSFGSFWGFRSFWSFWGFGSFGSFSASPLVPTGGREMQILFGTTARIGSSLAELIR